MCLDVSPQCDIITRRHPRNDYKNITFVDRLTNKTLFQLRADKFAWSYKQTWLVTTKHTESGLLVEVRDARTGEMYAQHLLPIEGEFDADMNVFEFIDENTCHIGWREYRTNSTIASPRWRVTCNATQSQFKRIPSQHEYFGGGSQNDSCYEFRSDHSVLYLHKRSQKRWPVKLIDFLSAVGLRGITMRLRYSEDIEKHTIERCARPDSWFPIVRVTSRYELLGVHTNANYVYGSWNGRRALYSLHPRMPGWLLQLLLTTIILLPDTPFDRWAGKRLFKL